MQAKNFALLHSTEVIALKPPVSCGVLDNAKSADRPVTAFSSAHTEAASPPVK